MIDHVAGVILGAGQATRMGRSKVDLPFGDTTLLGWAVRQAEASTLDDVVVVVAPGNEKVATGRTRVVVNETPHRGSMSSVLAAVGATGAVAVMVLLADTPGVETPTIEYMLEAWRADPRWAATARYDGEVAHPLILSPFLTAAMEGRHGDKVLWPMFESAPDAEVLHIDIAGPRPRDINTHQDYVLACREAGFDPAPEDGR